VLCNIIDTNKSPKRVEGEFVTLEGQSFYRIRHHDWMDPFFMSVVSSSNHWLFLASTGGISAGRVSPDGALFPYYTDDRITENWRNTGPITVLKVRRQNRVAIWQPFADFTEVGGTFERSIYKNLRGNTVIFEEVQRELGLAFRYSWRTSDRYGFVRTAVIEELEGRPCAIEVLDGLQNLLPAGTDAAMQNKFSNLLDAYKRGEYVERSGLGIFSYSSLPTDLAEPNEALTASVAWQRGLEPMRVLLSSKQVPAVLRGLEVQSERESRGVRCAFLVIAKLELKANEAHQWWMVADVGLDSAEVASLQTELQEDTEALIARLETDIAEGSAMLDRIVGMADGIQHSADMRTIAHHYTDVLFNVMRGGIFANGYTVDRVDLVTFIETRNRHLLDQQAEFFRALPGSLQHRELLTRARKTGNPSLIRLCHEYMPLMFGRRHGDPSRPWNLFAINLRNKDGSLKLDYQGNWRDIFQNWEALAWSYPEYVESMIFAFLNATTADGYNPYRVMRSGIDWEVLEGENPWSNIGYWSDHQIIYLVKLLELSRHFHPGKLESLLDVVCFSHADVPYRIKEYEQLLKDPFHSIIFDKEAHERALARAREIGSDGKLMLNARGEVAHVSMMEKLLTLLLAKLGNFLPEGGIWMNTQRPEWNDANNALAGKGLSVVTTAYLYRFLNFVKALVAQAGEREYHLTQTIFDELADIRSVLEAHRSRLTDGFDDVSRRAFLDGVGQASSRARQVLYIQGIVEETRGIDAQALLEFFGMVQAYLEETLRKNRREDGLYHAYNVVHFGEKTASISYLEEMLEGQVAVLSSGFLTGAQSLDLMTRLRASRLYRKDQYSYILYPNRDLPGFLEKNRVPAEAVRKSRLLMELARRKDHSILVQDNKGEWHFAPVHKNARYLRQTLESLARDPELSPLVEAERNSLLELYEAVFNHKYFTGRSGSFFAYEGLGSIYWHMVSKYLLAALESYDWAVQNQEDSATIAGLASAYREIRAGLGFNKDPAEYGAFPTDPYSHTPAHAGAKQPGMTGAVKEEILARLRELGIRIERGRLGFEPRLVSEGEFIGAPGQFRYHNVEGRQMMLDLPARSLAFTLCQVPVVYVQSEEEFLRVAFASSEVHEMLERFLDEETSASIFRREGLVHHVTVGVRPHAL